MERKVKKAVQMIPYIQTYMQFFGYGIDDRIPCEYCGFRANDIHHIIPRSRFGKKRIAERDDINNLCALCRSCHDLAHANKITVEDLQYRHEQKLLNAI